VAQVVAEGLHEDSLLANGASSVHATGHEKRLPAALLERFAGSAIEQMSALLRFLSPLSGWQAQAF
jgi:hypothetical protein